MNFIMFIGPSGCGKSTCAKGIADLYGFDIHSSDAIRGALWGDENDQRNPDEVFAELHKRVRSSLSNGKSVVYDATNLSAKRRRNYLKTLKEWEAAHNIKVHHQAIVVVAALETCWVNNHQRDRHVRSSVIEKHFKQIQLPWYNEGWDEIKYVINSKEITWGEILHYLDIPHDNKHHPNDVLAHSLKVGAALGEPYSDGWKLGALHDLGKPMTKTWKKANGEDDGNAHYYNHHYVGAYMSLLVDSGIGMDKYRRAMAIQYHMEPHFRDEEALSKFYEGLNDEVLVQMIKTLHEADKNNP